MKKITVSPLVLGALIVALVVVLSALLTSLRPTANSPQGFVLPPGDAANGQDYFVQLGCHTCHTVDGVTLVAPEVNLRDDLMVPLGGKLAVPKTYGELVTSIIHPGESIRPGPKGDYVDAAGNSLMPNYAETMTVQQVADLVTFLQQHYEVYDYDPNLPGGYGVY